MKIETKSFNSTLYIKPYGRITSFEINDLSSVINCIDSQISSVVFDMEHVEYISSVCLRILLTLRQKFDKNNCVKLINCNTVVFDILKTTGFDQLLEINSAEPSFDFSKASLKEILSFRAEHNDNDTFINYLNRDYTWKEIDVLSQIIAYDLSQKGVKQFSHVGIVGSNSLNYILCFFALQKIGAISVLLNNRLTAEEIVSQCKTGDVSSLCIGNYSSVEKDKLIRNEGFDFVYDISDTLDFQSRASEHPEICNLFSYCVNNDNPAVMIFSSGSTGKPKAVLLSVANLLCDSQDQIKKWNIQFSDSLCLVIPLFHILGLQMGLIYSMIMNNRICITIDSKTNTIIDTVAKQKCTMLHLVPTLLIALINSKAFSKEALSTLRISVMAGASASEAQIINAMEMLPNLHLINLYGLSEINPLSATIYNDSMEHICKTVGKASKSVSVKILNMENGCVCKEYETGEILAKGDNSFLCYYKMPAENQAIDFQGFVHTGDLGFMDGEGYVHITGRIKDIIIRGGENILPQEVANAITNFKNIKEVLVFGYPDRYFGECVAACLSLKDNSRWDELELRSFLKNKLAAFKIPSQYLVLDELPKLGNGKLDRETIKRIFHERTNL